MGLTNRERTGKILYSVREIIEKAESLKDLSLSYSCKEKIHRLIGFCDNLWPSLIGCETNPSHWLLGSSSHDLVLQDKEDLWSVAICSSIPQVEEGEIINNDLKDIDGFNPVTDMLNISALLLHADKQDIGRVCEIYQLLENITYALRRYDDDYLENKKEFSDLIANIQGTCFSIFYENVDFASCYIVHQICRILYTDHYRIKDEEEYKDVVDEWLHSQNVHHHMTRVVGRSGESIDWLAKQHLILLGSEGVELKKNRVLVALRMSGRRYHYDHEYKELVAILGKDKDLTDKPFLDALAAGFAACKKAKVDDDEDSRKSYKEDNKPFMLYGYNALPKKEVVVPKKEKTVPKKSKKNAKPHG